VVVSAVTALALAAVLTLAVDPHCGAATPGSEFAQRITAIAIHESGGDPLVIGVNADPSRGLPAAVVRSATARDAARQARTLLAQGRSVDLGLMQINSSQLARHGLTVDAAFDACRNMAAGAEHYAADVAAV
jgi:type IV secretion system protein VirB1